MFTGLSFKTQKYNWQPWYDQHNALYSLETLKFIANKLTMNILETGHRAFVSENYTSKKNILPLNVCFIKLCIFKNFELQI